MYDLKLCFLVLAILAPTLVPAEDKYENILFKYGYIQLKTGKDKDSEPTKKELTKAIMKFQEFNGLVVTGVLDEHTTKKMLSPRCGVEDIERSHGRGARKWAKKDLTWFVEKYSETPIEKKEQIDAIEKALARWAAVSKLNFKEGKSDSDINVQFGRNEHGDGYPFDEAGGVLAHAFYPENGRIHFDDAENWQSDKNIGTNLEVVAAHEFGHILGLSHSKVHNSMMAPYYQGFMKDLHKDDIERIQKLYGINDVTTTTTTTTTPPPTTTMILPAVPDPGASRGFCGQKYAKVNAAMKIGPRGGTYLFVDDTFVIIGSNGRRKRNKRVFSGGPRTVNAAVFSEDLQKALLFSGNKVWSFSLSGGKFYKDLGYPKSHSDTKFNKPDAAMILRDDDGIERVFVFKDNNMREWLTHYDELPAESTFVSADFFPGIPSHIDAALSVKKQIIFLSGQIYYTMNTNIQFVTESDESMTSLLGICTRKSRRRKAKIASFIHTTLPQTITKGT